MNNTRPFTEAHAIAAVDVALVLRDELDNSGREFFAELLGAHLKDFSRANRGDVVVFQRKIDEDVAEEVHIHDHYIHVVVLDYRGWTLTRQNALDRLEPILQRARDGQLGVARLGLIFTDVFVNEKPETYSAFEVFKRDCRWLPGSAFSSGKDWKSAFSWRDETENLRIRSQLSIEASVQSFDDADAEKAHFTEIKHRQEILGNISDPPAVEWSHEQLDMKLSLAHQRNKSLLVDCLVPEMSERIGLKEFL